MHIVKLIGGLGNQMFQYALYRVFIEMGQECKIDISDFKNYKLHNGYELERVFHLKPLICNDSEKNKLSNSGSNFLNRIKRKIQGRKATEYIENSCLFDSSVLHQKEPKYFEGYWQSEKYFSSIEYILKKEFSFHEIEDLQNKSIQREIINSNSVSLHVRRGDYVNNPLYDNICDSVYYCKAIRRLETELANPTYYIISNDIDWCKANLPEIQGRSVFIEWNNTTNSYRDMQLMSLCKHNIIANSSFSWWGAWLNNNPNKIVIAPKKWFNDDSADCRDIVPEKWIRL